MAHSIYWGVTEHGGFRLHLARTDSGLCYVETPGEGTEELQRQCRKRFPDADFIHAPEALAEYKRSLERLLDGSAETITLPFDVTGTDFQQAIWEALKTIPYGQTVSYSELAARVGKPQAVRAVGSAVGANPLMIFIPCHRVIRKNGNVTGFRGGMELKHYLLHLENSRNAAEPPAIT